MPVAIGNPQLLAAGRTEVQTHGAEWGQKTVDVPQHVRASANDFVLLTPKTSGKHGQFGGPLYCAFVKEMRGNQFDIIVYDISSAPHDVEIIVDWIILRNNA